MKRWSLLSASVALAFALLVSGRPRPCAADPGFDDLEMSGAKAEWDNWLTHVENAVKANDKRALSSSVAPGARVYLVYDGRTVPSLLSNDARGWQDVVQALREGHVDTLDLRRDGQGIRRRAQLKRDRDGETVLVRDVDVEYSDSGWRIAGVTVKDPVEASPLQPAGPTADSQIP